jgi:hypothetical protein
VATCGVILHLGHGEQNAGCLEFESHAKERSVRSRIEVVAVTDRWLPIPLCVKGFSSPASGRVGSSRVGAAVVTCCWVRE